PACSGVAEAKPPVRAVECHPAPCREGLGLELLAQHLADVDHGDVKYCPGSCELVKLGTDTSGIESVSTPHVSHTSTFARSGSRVASKMTDSVSVIVPAFNAARYLGDA